MRHRLAESLPRSRPSFEASWRAGDERRNTAALASEKVLKQRLIERLHEVARSRAWIQSATLTGSFLTSPGLEGISDIDFVLVVEELQAARFAELQEAFRAALAPELAAAGYRLQINSTLGPLKFNDPRTAVLHLMVYSTEAHVNHAIQSPFTCLDWQRSPSYAKRSLAEVYPVFGLQPRHFINARRSLRDYLKDFRAGVVSYRELECHDCGYRELPRSKPMDGRDRHEFAYHILRFLMQNVLKLVTRRNETSDGETLLRHFQRHFPGVAAGVPELYRELAQRKRRLEFNPPVPQLEERLEAFLGELEHEIRRIFITEATRHLVVRHAATAWNTGEGASVIFQGRSDVPAQEPSDEQWNLLLAAVGEQELAAVYVSPASRTRQTVHWLAERTQLPEAQVDARLHEIHYGRCEGLTVTQARGEYPQLFAAWHAGEDRKFPGGESTTDVLYRAANFAAERWTDGRNTLTCTHNVVLRCLVGEALSVPRSEWHRLKMPHLRPITFVHTRQFGWFVDLDEATEREMFAGFVNNVENTRRILSTAA